jgi:hypothetical protein
MPAALQKRRLLTDCAIALPTCLPAALSQMKEKEKFDALVALPPIEVALADKFSK